MARELRGGKRKDCTTAPKLFEGRLCSGEARTMKALLLALVVLAAPAVVQAARPVVIGTNGGGPLRVRPTWAGRASASTGPRSSRARGSGTGAPPTSSSTGRG